MMEPRTVASIAVVAGGLLAGLQAPSNALLAQATRSPVNAALVAFTIASLGLVAAALVARTPPDLGAVRALPWYAWLGGVYGAVFVTASAFAVPRIGAGMTVTLFLIGQMSMSVWLDQVGGLGLMRQPLNATRLIGLGLLFLGAALVRRS